MRKLSMVGSLVCLLSPMAVAQGPSSVVDPFFLIEYNPGIIHFESIPASLSNRCKTLQNFYANGWVYGHVKTGDTEYFITYGYVTVDFEDGHGSMAVVPEEDGALAIELRDQSCRVDQAQFFLRKQINPAKNATPITVPDSALDAIAADIVDRYAQAFGGKSKFLPHVTPLARNDLPPVVRKQLEKLEQ
jgi:hypothetical protein